MPRIDRRAIAAAWILALFAAGPAEACTISVTSVAFGSYDTISPANDDATGTLTAACHPSVQSPVVTIAAGSSGAILARAMVNGATTLNYNLYTDIGHTTIWGDGTTGASVTLTGGTVVAGQRIFNRTIYGRIPALQPVGAGLYTDTMVVTLTF